MTLYAWCIRAAVIATASLGVQLAHAAAACEKLEGCAAKACRIDAQIEEAKAAGQDQGPSLARARARRDRPLQRRRAQAEAKGRARSGATSHRLRQDDLKKAEAKGDPAKIKKAQKNLDSAQHAYDEIKNSPL